MGWLTDKAKEAAKDAAKRGGSAAVHKLADATGAGPRTDKGGNHCSTCNQELNPRKKNGGHMNGCDGASPMGAIHSGETEMTKAEYATAIKKGQKFKRFRVVGNKVFVEYH